MTLKNSEYNIPNDSVTFSNDIFSILPEDNFVKFKKDQLILNIPCVFDIEVSSFYEGDEKRACMYAWVFGMNGRCIRGRTWYEFLEVIQVLKYKYDLNDKKRIVIYVHNLSYEFQFIRKYFEWSNVFSIDSRKPIYAITKDGIEFRCSYLLSGYNLEKLGDNLTKYKVKKAVGDLDYRLIRHAKTPLSPKEWGYILNDGLVVMAYIQEEIERLGDISKIPLTNTGRVREHCRDRCLRGNNGREYVKLMRKLTLTVEDYKQLKQAYTGGFTHANVNYVDKVIENVHSFDFSSSYPAVMLSEKYPMSKAHHTVIDSLDKLLYFINKYCCMFDVTFYNLQSCVDFENYISSSRCKPEHFRVNNGRIIEAEKLTMTVTEQDFKIISKMYTWDEMDISNFTYFYKGYLPKDFILTILELYKNKTELKGVEGKEVEYLVSKGMINSCYGMCVTDPCRDEIIYDVAWNERKGDTESLIKAYNNNYNRVLYYPWGVWITAYARANLFSGILEFKNDYIYSDTDSIKVLNIEAHKRYLAKYNEDVTRKVYDCLKYYNIDTNLSHPKTIKGIEKPIGVWDYEGKYDRFKTLGAKRYMTENEGDINITVAGVSKKAGKKYLKYNYKDNTDIFNHFTENLTFPAYYNYNGEEENGSGKLCHTYIDDYTEGTITDYLNNEFIYNERSSIHMENTEYTMSVESQFKLLIEGVKISELC